MKGTRVIEKTEFSFGVSKKVALKVDPAASPFGVCTELMTPFAEEKAKLLKDSGIFWIRQPIREERLEEKQDWEEMEGAVGFSDALSSIGDCALGRSAAVIENRHADLRALAERAQEVVFRHAHMVEG